MCRYALGVPGASAANFASCLLTLDRCISVLLHMVLLGPNSSFSEPNSESNSYIGCVFYGVFCVKDLIPRNADVLLPLLRHPKCHTYVCGGGGMAEGVSSALESLLGEDALAAAVEDGR